MFRTSRWVPAITATALVITVFLLWPRPDRQPRIREEKDENGPSGALAALDVWSAQRAYPNPVVPDVGHALAFSQAQAMRAASSGVDESVDPWSSLGPNNIGGRTLALAVRPDAPDVIFAASASGGLWKSTTGGAGADAWDLVETGHPVSAVGAIALDPSDPDVMYVGTGEVYAYQSSIGGEGIRTTRGSYGIGILKSTDGGVTWTKSLDWSLAQTRGVQSVRVHPTNPSIVFAGTTEGVYRSTDAGGTWSNVHAVLMATDVRIHPTTPNLVLAACGNFGSAGTGIYRSTDGGTFWVEVGNGLPTIWSGKALLDIAPSAPDIIYASIANSESGRGLWKSLDAGASWFQVSSVNFQQYQGFYSHWVLVDPADADHVFVGGIEIWESSNGGATLTRRSNWQDVYFGTSPPEGPIGGPQYAHADHHAALWHPTEPNTVFFASDGGVFKTTDGGSTFESLIGGYATTQFYNGFANSATNPNLAIGGLQDNFTNIYEGTTSWRRVIGGDGGWAAIDATDDQNMYATYQYLGVVRSDDGMASWDFVEPPEHPNDWTAFIAPLLLSPSEPAVLYGGRSRVYKSYNQASSWVAVNGGNPLNGSNPVLSMAMSATDSDTVYAATAPLFSRARVFRTADGGSSWTEVTGLLPDRYPMDMAVDPGDSRRVYVALSGFGTSHLFGSTDAGATWTDLGAGLPDVPASAIEVDPDHPDVLYVGNDLGVWVSPDWGATWHPFARGMPTALVNDLKVFAPGRKLRAATHGNGAFERDLFDPALVGAPEVAAGSGATLSVRPNPMRGAGRIRFELPREARVSLALYDVTGRRVLALLDDTRPAGRHEMNLDPRDLAPGVYFARLEAGRHVEVSRIVYVR